MRYAVLWLGFLAAFDGAVQGTAAAGRTGRLSGGVDGSQQYHYVSTETNGGVVEMVKLFREKVLDPMGHMAGTDFRSGPTDRLVPIVREHHWSPISVRGGRCACVCADGGGSASTMASTCTRGWRGCRSWGGRARTTG